MTPDEINSIKANITRIREVNLAETLAASFPNSDLSQKRFHDLSADDLINFSNRALDQFEIEVEGPNARFLSRGYYWQTRTQPMQHRHVDEVLNNFATLVGNKNWNGASQHLELLVGYQLQAGFWDRRLKKTSVSQNRVRQQELFSNLNTRSEQLKKLIADATKQKTDVEQLLAQRQVDAQSVASQLAIVQKQATEVTTIVARSSNENGQLVQILASQKEILTKIQTHLTEIEKSKDDLGNALKDAADRLEQSGKRLAFMEEKEAIVNEIAGTAGAGLLGQKFEARMRQLASSARWWLLGTVLSVVAAGVWLWFAHMNIMTQGADPWSTLALNFGLLLPAIFIVGFFAAQFGKTRHFEEEYAFRSSVAMTLGAFADRLRGKEDEHDDLISETVEKLYRLPILLQEKDEGGGWFKQRAVERTLKTAVELVKEVKTPPSR